MNKILLISNTLTHYRIPLYESLCDEIELTIAHSSKLNKTLRFQEYSITVKKRGPFIIYDGLPCFDKYDVVIFPFNIRCLQLLKTVIKKRNFKVAVFGIGVSASYNKRYDQDKRLDFVRKFILNKSDAGIFYESYPYIKYLSYNNYKNKYSVAFNTVAPNLEFDFSRKEFISLIFIGSLYKQKRIFDLLDAYDIAYRKTNGNIPCLELIGDGEEYENISFWVSQKHYNQKIKLYGKIENDAALFPILNRAIACISPGQAGLSVQKCFSYGIPFVTSTSAITGGEISSIIDGFTGFLYDGSVSQLSQILVKITLNKESIKKMSSDCFNFYNQYRNINIWKRGFLKNIAD